MKRSSERKIKATTCLKECVHYTDKCGIYLNLCMICISASRMLNYFNDVIF